MNVKRAFYQELRGDRKAGPSPGWQKGRSVRSSGDEPKIAATDHLGAMAFQSVLVNSRQ